MKPLRDLYYSPLGAQFGFRRGQNVRQVWRKRFMKTANNLRIKKHHVFSEHNQDKEVFSNMLRKFYLMTLLDVLSLKAKIYYTSFVQIFAPCLIWSG